MAADKGLVKALDKLGEYYGEGIRTRKLSAHLSERVGGQLLIDNR